MTATVTKPAANATTVNTEEQQRGPTEKEQRAIAEATERARGRAQPPHIEVVNDEVGKATIGPPHSDVNGWYTQINDLFATGSSDLASILCQQLGNITKERRASIGDGREFNAGIGAVAEIAPENGMEAMLATQMIGSHMLAMDMLTRAKFAETREAMQEFGTLATKMQRTFTTQLETLAKIRRKGQQNVTVKHVHVHEGGQAIVGNVNHSGRGVGGGNRGNGHQPHEADELTGLGYAPGAEMWCPDESRDALPISSNPRQEAVQTSRRSQGKRRAGRAG